MDDDLERLLTLLESSDDRTVGTSIRVPGPLREAAALAARMGATSTVTELAVAAVRSHLEAFAQRRLLDAHYIDHPEARPTLAEIAQARAELDGDPSPQAST